MAIVLSKSFMRTISQNTNENLQTGISLWTLEDVLKEQLKARQAGAMYLEPPSVGAKMDIDDDEFDDGGIPDEMLAEADLGI